MTSIIKSNIDLENISCEYVQQVVEYFSKNPRSESFIFNHIWRVLLQCELKKDIETAVRQAINTQLDDGGWGYNNHPYSVLGITATVVQLLFWSKSVISDNKSLCLEIDMVIQSAVHYILGNQSNGVYWEENKKNTLIRNHGLIDLNHYVCQALYYFWLETKNKDIYIKYQNLCEWYISLQKPDGSWNEIDKKRTIVGATTDAVRALLPNTDYKRVVLKGTDYLVKMQDSRHGFWDGGNRDKSIDAMKTLLSTSMLFHSSKYQSNINLGLNYLYSLRDSVSDIEEVCDLATVFLSANCFYRSNKSIKYF